MIPVLKERNIIESKWVYQTKQLANTIIERHKGQGVAQSFSQIPVVDLNIYEISCTVVRHEWFQFLLTLTAYNCWESRQFGVKSLFLYGELNEDINMRSLPKYKEDDIYRLLKKCLYGLKQSAHKWYGTLPLPQYSNRGFWNLVLTYLSSSTVMRIFTTLSMWMTLQSSDHRHSLSEKLCNLWKMTSK